MHRVFESVQEVREYLQIPRQRPLIVLSSTAGGNHLAEAQQQGAIRKEFSLPEPFPGEADLLVMEWRHPDEASLARLEAMSDGFVTRQTLAQIRLHDPLLGVGVLLTS